MAIKLYSYQNEAENQFIDLIKKNKKRILLQAHTGWGKTYLAYHLISRAISKDNVCLFIAPRRSLVNQAYNDFVDIRKHCSIAMGSTKKFDSSKLIQIGTPNTIVKKKFSNKIIFIIIDEIHEGWDASRIKKIISEYPDAIILGMSATPEDEKGYLLEGFEAIIQNYSLPDAIEDGNAPKFKKYIVGKLELSEIKTNPKTGEYNEEELDEYLMNNISNVVEQYEKHGENFPFAVYCNTIKHAEQRANEFVKAGYNVKCVHSKNSDKDNNKIFQEFREGKIQGIISVAMIYMGWSEPRLRCSISLIPTKIRRKYIQMVGRLARKSDGKDYVIFIDCAGNIEEFDIPETRWEFKFKPKFSETVDKMLNIENTIEAYNDGKIDAVMCEARIEYLKQISKQLDIYKDKYYSLEKDLEKDVKKFLSKTNYFWWRQNSGRAFFTPKKEFGELIYKQGYSRDSNGRWVCFASKSGLPDITVIFGQRCPFYIGIELKKSKGGSLTDNQKITFPEMIQKGCLLFIARSVIDVFEILEHVNSCLTFKDDCVIISNNLYKLSDKQIAYREFFKLPLK